MADHRTEVGGMWNKIGQLQFEFLLFRGLRPDHYLLDVGCGPLRGGVNFIQYLNHGHYFGIDKHVQFLRAAKEIELPRYKIEHRQPNLHLNSEFDLSFVPREIYFDYILAFALFNHLDPATIKLCLKRMVPRLQGKLYATFIEGDKITRNPLPHPKRPGEYLKVEYPLAYFRELASILNLRMTYVEDFGHPRCHSMLIFERW